MKFIADFHIHSHYSVATSKELTPEYLDYWARIKGIGLVGSGDFTHPGWIKELKEKLEPAEPGLFRLKSAYKNDPALQTPFLPETPVRFMLTAEISSIYKKKGKVRKVHNVIFAPDFAVVEGIQQKLTAIGANITSDGRPILGLDAHDLLDMALEVSDRVFFVPAHIWTPWFSVLGDKSGFDSIEECFDDLSGHIRAVETGLSSDPPMNWMCSFLDRYTLISNSDAHSPEKLGRNANRFDTELSYGAVVSALKEADPSRFLGTIDLFPQEGKYHYDGHRRCGVCLDPLETLKHRRICPVCGKPVTVGVMNRVAHISDRPDISQKPNPLPFYHIIPLKEILAEIIGTSADSRKVADEYLAIVKKGNAELPLLLDRPIGELAGLGPDELPEAIRRMRAREVRVQEGYDGEYGQIKVFASAGKRPAAGQKGLFAGADEKQAEKPEPRPLINFDLGEYRRLQAGQEAGADVGGKEALVDNDQAGPDFLKALNVEQRQAVLHPEGPALVLAGPGTGKTRVLTERIVHLIRERGVEPGRILAVTFTNKAAGEMRHRLHDLLDESPLAEQPLVTTFHGLGLAILKECLSPGSGVPGAPLTGAIGRDEHFTLVDEEDKKLILQSLPSGDPDQYQAVLRRQDAFDLDDLIAIPRQILAEFPDIRTYYRQKYTWLLVDEYQDINLTQYELIQALLAEETPNLCVIGDPDQAIYGFRGADVAFIRRFRQDYPQATLYRLKQSYRCSDTILRASGEVMQKKGAEAAALAGLEKGVKVKIVRQPTHKSEAEFVARTIEEMMGGLRFFSMDSSISRGEQGAGIDSLADFAVLCRVRSQLEALQKAFQDHTIPCQVVGDQPFFKQEPVRSIIDVLRFAQHPDHPFLQEKLARKGVLQPAERLVLQSAIKPGQPVNQALQVIIGRYFTREQADNESLVHRLLGLAGDFAGDIEGFLRLATLGTGIDAYRPGLEQVALMTLHAAKGLEFACVFIVGCEEGLLPYSLYQNRQGDPEEERRLLYVGMTRAKKFLFLSHADRRLLQGREFQLKRSSLLEPIEKGLIELTSQAPRPRKGDDGFTPRPLF